MASRAQHANRKGAASAGRTAQRHCGCRLPLGSETSQRPPSQGPNVDMRPTAPHNTPRGPDVRAPRRTALLSAPHNTLALRDALPALLHAAPPPPHRLIAHLAAQVEDVDAAQRDGHRGRPAAPPCGRCQSEQTDDVPALDQRAQKSREQRPGKASRGSAACSRSACKPSPAPSSRDAHSDLSAQVSRLEVHGVGRLPFCPWPRGPWPVTLSRIKRGSACRRYQRDPQGT